jgi:hypothetical protein
MHGPFVLLPRIAIVRRGFGIRLRLRLGFCFLEWVWCFVSRHRFVNVFRDLRFHVGSASRAGPNHTFRLFARQGAGLSAAGGRHFRALVLMLRLTRRAARLLHLVVDHRNDGVIGDAALARTIVVQNVTEPDPALLHELPRSVIPQGTRQGVPADPQRNAGRASR